MKFAVPDWLFGSALAVLVAIALIVGGILASRNVKRFGDEALVHGLLTANARGRRALKGVLLVLAVGLAFLALAQPQYGRGTRLIPATNLDVVIVLDYSKSMYAKDIAPSRILRAKSEVGRLIADLPGARFGAIAFAGEPMAFPLTSDGAAIAQFFRQLSPNDMPVGGTAIARALEAGRELLERDPKSKQHRRVMLLVTDGEDLEGDPVAVAESAKQADITINVVQIGGRTPEPIPDVNEAGEQKGFRVDDSGKPLTTALSAEGEEQLSKIATATGGVIVQSAKGETGISEISRRLARLVTEELSEKVETVYADVYMYPLGLALLLVLIETFVNEAKRRSKPSAVPPPKRPRRKKGLKKAAVATTLGLLAALCFVAACGKSADKLFERHAPDVDQALAAYDAGDAGSAVSLLEQYLATGKCENGEIGTPDPVRERPNATFDLGLGLFKLAERFGKRFGEEDPVGDGGTTPEQDSELGQRSQGVECALRVLRVVAADPSTPVEFRARARYLSGNLEFLRRDYKAAVKEYDAALRLIPGVAEDAGDGIGRDAAFNRAIALRRIEDKENKERDAAPDASNDDGGQPDGGDQPDSGKQDQQPDSGQQQQPDAGKDDKKDDQKPDAGGDGGSPPPQNKPDPQQDQQKPQPEPSQTANQDDRMLDMLEHAPTVQEQDAKNRALQGRSRSGMEDK